MHKYHKVYERCVTREGRANGSQYFISQSITHNYISRSSLQAYINIWKPKHNIITTFRPPLRESCLEYTFDFRTKGRQIGKQFMK